MAALLELNRSQLSGGECAVLAWSIDSGKYSRLTIDRGSGMRSTSAGTSVPTADYNAESDVRLFFGLESFHDLMRAESLDLGLRRAG